MARRRDVRRFGRGPYVLGLQRGPQPWGDGFPYDVPAVAAIEELSLDAPITLLVGDNGTGKSTIVEAIGEAMGFAAEGGELEAVRFTRGLLDAPECFIRAALDQ